ncbi:MAG: division/cell wall cluster transcriptional repressor MraZ [Gemmatimonas sp.]
MFRGSAPARVDDKGRLKVPSVFKALLESQYGRELFVTSLTGEYVRLYPMPVWLQLERKLAALPSTDPTKQRLLNRVNFYGQVAELDSQDRVLIPMRLRDSATMAGDVDVLGQIEFLDVWNHDRFQARLEADPLSDADFEKLSGLGI